MSKSGQNISFYIIYYRIYLQGLYIYSVRNKQDKSTLSNTQTNKIKKKKKKNKKKKKKKNQKKKREGNIHDKTYCKVLSLSKKRKKKKVSSYIQ